MARRRWGLILLSVVSLVVLVYAGVFTAFSVPVTGDMERASRLPNETEPAAGLRALVVPLSDPTVVPTVATGDPNGTLLLVGDAGFTFPAGATNVSLVRALAYVAPTANGSYQPGNVTFSNLPYVDGGNATATANASVRRENVTVDVASLAGGKAGFLVKADARPNVFFVSIDRVAGTVARFDPGSFVYAMFAIGAVGFVAPLVVIIVTHRGAPAGRAGPGAAIPGYCRECRAVLDPGAPFCTKCGAYQDGRGGVT